MVEYGLLKNPPVEGTVNSVEQKARVICQIGVQEFHIRFSVYIKLQTYAEFFARFQICWKRREKVSSK